MSQSKTAQKSSSTSFRRAAIILISGFIALLFFKNSDAAAKFVSRGATLCIEKLIPSLFPFLVISSLLVSSGLDKPLGRTLGKPLAIILGISAEGACAVILGFICGFPVGAKCACGLMREGKISRAECERLLAVCSIPSPAFVIGVLGEDILGSRADGYRLWGSCAACALIVGLLLRFISPLPKRSALAPKSEREYKSFGSLLTSAVKDGAKSMLYVCAFVIFFSSFLGALDAVLSPLSLGKTAGAILFGFFELTSGAMRISDTAPDLRFALCALAAGWSGLSVHFQTMAICSDADIKFTLYLISHAVRAVIGLLVSVVLECIL